MFLHIAATRRLPSVRPLGRSPVCRNPSIHAASSLDEGAAVLAAASLRDVFRIGKASSLDTDAPSAVVVQSVG